MPIEYRLTEKGSKAKINPTPAGKVLEYMQQGRGVVNEHEIKYELQTIDARQLLEELIQGGYLEKKVTK